MTAYRLYQVAGTGHINGRHELATNRLQMADRGWPVNPAEVNERLTDGRLDLVARAVFAAVDRWMADGTVPPPDAKPLRLRRPGGPGHPRHHAGIACPSPATPTATSSAASAPPGSRYRSAATSRTAPRSPAAASRPRTPPTPTRRCSPTCGRTWLPFPRAELARRYGDRDQYLARLEAAALTAVNEGWLLAEDLPEYLADARETAADVW